MVPYIKKSRGIWSPGTIDSISYGQLEMGVENIKGGLNEESSGLMARGNIAVLEHISPPLGIP
jgi:hypothetical protein